MDTYFHPSIPALDIYPLTDHVHAVTDLPSHRRRDGYDVALAIRNAYNNCPKCMRPDVRKSSELLR